MNSYELIKFDETRRKELIREAAADRLARAQESKRQPKRARVVASALIALVPSAR